MGKSAKVLYIVITGYDKCIQDPFHDDNLEQVKVHLAMGIIEGKFQCDQNM